MTPYLSKPACFFHLNDFHSEVYSLHQFEVIGVVFDIFRHVRVMRVVWRGVRERKVREAVVILGHIAGGEKGQGSQIWP